MARLTKKQLQTDQLEHALTDAKDYVVTHRRETVRWTVIAVAVLAVVAGVVGATTLRSRRLDARLSEAVGLFDAPLVTDGVPAAEGRPVFGSAAERLAAIRKELSGLVKDAPSSEAGRAAAVMLLSLDGPVAATPANLRAAEALAKDEPGSAASGVAALSAIDARAAAGNPKGALDLAKRYLDQAEAPLPKDVLVYTVGRLCERMGQLAEAKTYYQRLVADFPDSPMRGDAQQRLAGL